MAKLQDLDNMTKAYGCHNTGAFNGLGIFFLGSFMGIATGLLLAPRGGQETRTKIKQKALDVLDKSRDKMGNVMDKAKDKVEQTSEKTSQVAEVAKQAVSDLKEQQPKMNSKYSR
ncbi:YtxH domain-containing protein [Candidatus Saccharibacteria bacterium]|nr:MAG: YtxH domain-containing protein [Candidatus Saccharibacteria bacterium]